MTRVSENSASASLNFALNKSKEKLEDLQLKGSTLKKISRPSDNPLSNVEALSINSANSDGNQYLRNADYAIMNLEIIDKTMDQLVSILGKAKEIAIAQSSDFYGEDVRKNIATEVRQLRKQAISLGNQRVGQRYLFSGFNTLTRPFSPDGKYHGDKGEITVEVAKDFFTPINLNGSEVFFSSDNVNKRNHPLNNFPQLKTSPSNTPEHKSIKENPNGPPQEVLINRDLASVEYSQEERNNIFSQLETLAIALENDQPEVIQNLLEDFDKSTSRIITLRTRIGSITNSVQSSKVSVEGQNLDRTTRKSSLVDADIAELFADISKQQDILKTTYKSSAGTINLKLLDFIR